MSEVSVLPRLAARRRPGRAIRVPWRGPLALAVGLFFGLPVLWLVSSALKPLDQFYASPPALLPSPPSVELIVGALRSFDVARLALNSTLVALLSTVATVASSALVGFAFATLPARGSRVLFATLVATMLVPPAALIVPQFILFSRLGWVGTYLPLVVPHLLGSAFYIFLFRQWFRSLPAHVFESAELDGASPLQAFRHVGLPLSRPALAAVGVFAFVASWNDFLGPLVYLTSPDSFTLPVGIAMLHGVHVNEVHFAVALALIALLPPILVFAFAQRWLVRGIPALGWRR